MDRGRREKTEPLDSRLANRKEDTERKILDLLERRGEGGGRAHRHKEREREGEEREG